MLELNQEELTDAYRFALETAKREGEAFIYVKHSPRHCGVTTKKEALPSEAICYCRVTSS